MKKLITLKLRLNKIIYIMNQINIYLIKLINISKKYFN